MSPFEKQLAFGKTGESLIAGYFKRRGFAILPVYERLDNEFKGPAIYMADGTNIVAPDMLIFGNGKTFWIEAKHKSAFAWHRISQQWTTGIDTHHYLQYLKVRESSDWPLWLLFLHMDGRAKDTPPGMTSPTGLFGEDILKLSLLIDHTHKNWGKHGMTYWAHASLKLIAPLSEVCP